MFQAVQEFAGRGYVITGMLQAVRRFAESGQMIILACFRQYRNMLEAAM